MNSAKKYKLLSAILGLLFLPNVFCSAAEIPQPPMAPGANLPDYLTYIFNIGFAFGFAAVLLTMVVAGILLLLSPLSANAMAKAKDRLAGAASGFLILALTYLIVTTINPQLNDFKMQPRPKEPNLCPNGVENPDGTITCPPPKLPGVYFYQGTDCKGEFSGASTNIPDFNAFIKKSIKSANIIHDDQNNIQYIALVYSQKNYYGECQYIDPSGDTECNDIEISNINSATVYKYGQEPSGSVFIYRKASVNESAGDFYKDGGFVELTENDIGRLYEGKLSELKFVGEAGNKNSNNIEDCTVPKDEQDCKKWDKNGKCTEKECPKLTGTNISAIEIKGNYLVVLENVSKKNMTAEGSPGEVADFCQAYPSPDDVNKYGPKQVKWAAIRNNINFYPNYILIIPLEEK